MTNNQRPTLRHNSAQATNSYFKEYWYVFFLAGVLVLLFVAQILRFLTPKIAIQQDNTWHGITPGHSNVNDVQNRLGDPIGSTQIDGHPVLEYESIYKTNPNKVYLSSEGEVQFIKEYLDYRTEENISDYLNKYGDADLRLTEMGTSDAVWAHVFLNEGLVVIDHKKTGKIEQKWYFEPTTEENFLSAWGKSLSENDTIREVLDLY